MLFYVPSSQSSAIFRSSFARTAEKFSLSLQAQGSASIAFAKMNLDWSDSVARRVGVGNVVPAVLLFFRGRAVHHYKIPREFFDATSDEEEKREKKQTGKERRESAVAIGHEHLSQFVTQVLHPRGVVKVKSSSPLATEHDDANRASVHDIMASTEHPDLETIVRECISE